MFYLTGLKQILMSKQCIIDTEWDYLRNMNVVPFVDGEDTYNGCTLVLVQGPKCQPAEINLIESPLSEKNNLLSYESEICTVGQKRFEVKMTNSENYLLVITVKLKPDLIDMFDHTEAYAFQQKIIAQVLMMRRPDLEYLLLNTFERLRRQDFFIAQELLYGKSICDICLNTPKYVIEALDDLK